MNIFSLFAPLFSLSFYLSHWRDAVEIAFFSYLFYIISLWLVKDAHKNLLPYFYGYAIIGVGAYYLSLSTITTFLFLATPAAGMLLMLMHQETLQRNLVALKNVTTQAATTNDWVEDLFSACLTYINNNQPLYVLIERTDFMQPFLSIPLKISAALNKDILSVVLSSPSFDHNAMMVLNNSGQLEGINASWINHNQEEYTHNHAQWQQETLLYLAKTDSIAFHCDPVTRTFTIIKENTVVERVTAHQAQHLLKKALNAPLPAHSSEKKGVYYATHKKNNRKQPTA
jgi:hypothetical protein